MCYRRGRGGLRLGSLTSAPSEHDLEDAAIRSERSHSRHHRRDGSHGSGWHVSFRGGRDSSIEANDRNANSHAHERVPLLSPTSESEHDDDTLGRLTTHGAHNGVVDHGDAAPPTRHPRLIEIKFGKESHTLHVPHTLFVCVRVFPDRREARLSIICSCFLSKRPRGFLQVQNYFTAE